MFDQHGARHRFGWGPDGLQALVPPVDVVVIVDVLSFSTAVDLAVSRGAVVLPYRWADATAAAYAETNRATLAVRRPEPGRLSLRPSSLLDVDPGTRLVLPSPNGSTLAFAASEGGARRVFVAGLRNAAAVGAAVAELTAGDSAEAVAVAVIAAGERWHAPSHDTLRPAVEDLIGSGAVLDAIAAAEGVDPSSVRSPEAAAAVAVFRDARPALAARLEACGSGRELIDRGYGADVALAAELNVSTTAPRLVGPELRAAS